MWPSLLQTLHVFTCPLCHSRHVAFPPLLILTSTKFGTTSFKIMFTYLIPASTRCPLYESYLWTTGPTTVPKLSNLLWRSSSSTSASMKTCTLNCHRSPVHWGYLDVLRSKAEAIRQQAMELTVIIESQYCCSRAYRQSVDCWHWHSWLLQRFVVGKTIIWPSVFSQKSHRKLHFTNLKGKKCRSFKTTNDLHVCVRDVWWEKSMGIDTTGVRRESSTEKEQVCRCSGWRAIKCKLPKVEKQDGQFSTVQPLPKVKFLTNFFHRNQFFEWTHFSHVGRKRVEVWFDFERKQTEFFVYALNREERRIT